MALQTCCYEGCYVQRLPCSSTTFFRIPDDEPRRTQWIMHSGNKTLRNLKINQKRYFCEKHFTTKDFRSTNFRKQLYKNAVPMPYEGNNIKTTTNTCEKSDTNCTHSEEDKREYNHEYNNAGEAHRNIYYEINEISAGKFETDAGADLNYLYDVGDNGQDLQNYTLETKELLDMKDMISEDMEPTSTKSDETTVNDTNEIIDIDIDYEADSPTTNAAAAKPRSSTPASSIIVDIAHDVEDVTTTSTASNCIQNERGTITAMLLNENEEYNDCNSSITDTSSYESDKHYALSLVYYFQRLNAKKKAQAKINILSYLVALEQGSDDVELRS